MSSMDEVRVVSGCRYFVLDRLRVSFLICSDRPPRADKSPPRVRNINAKIKFHARFVVGTFFLLYSVIPRNEKLLYEFSREYVSCLSARTAN